MERLLQHWHICHPWALFLPFLLQHSPFTLGVSRGSRRGVFASWSGILLFVAFSQWISASKEVLGLGLGWDKSPHGFYWWAWLQRSIVSEHTVCITLKQNCKCYSQLARNTYPVLPITKQNVLLVKHSPMFWRESKKEMGGTTDSWQCSTGWGRCQKSRWHKGFWVSDRYNIQNWHMQRGSVAHWGDEMVLDIPYLLFSGCGTLMCYTDMKMSLRVELELGRQKKKNWERS